MSALSEEESGFNINDEDEFLWDQVDNSQEFEDIIQEDLMKIQDEEGMEALRKKIEEIQNVNANLQSLVDHDVEHLANQKRIFENLKREIFETKDEMDRLLEKKDVLSPILMSKGLPRNWQMYTEDEYKSNNGYIKVQLDQSSEEFVKVAQLFNSRGCGNINVLKIFRIQNPKLYRIFFCNLHQVRKKHASQSNIEIQKYLFHGSSYGNMEKIADQGFDYRLCGVNGTAYGQGNYFAYHSSYSLGYSRSSGSEKMMFLAMVITGSYTHGNSGLSIAPKDSKGIPYDSVVDNTSNPQIFVTFDNFKAYPAYVLIFK